MSELVLVVLLTLHLLLIDIAMAGPLVCVWLEWQGTRRDALTGDASLQLARLVSWALTLGILVGGLQLAIRWWLDDRAYFAAVAIIPRSRLWFALGELLFFFACMGGYTALWNRWRNHRLAHRLLAIAAATNLLIHFPALFAIISVLTTRPQLPDTPLDRAAFQLLLVDPEVLSRVVHVWLAAFAVTGVALMAFGTRPGSDASTPSSRERLIKQGALLGLVFSLLQIPAGLWVALEMPEAGRELLFGGDLWTTLLFAVSILLALHLMHRLAAIALGDHQPSQIRRSIAVMTLLVLLMTGTRCRVQTRIMSTQPRAETRTILISQPTRAVRLAEHAFQ